MSFFAINMFYSLVNLLLYPQKSSRYMIILQRARILAIVEPLAADGHQPHVH